MCFFFFQCLTPHHLFTKNKVREYSRTEKQCLQRLFPPTHTQPLKSFQIFIYYAGPSPFTGPRNATLVFFFFRWNFYETTLYQTLQHWDNLCQDGFRSFLADFNSSLEGSEPIAIGEDAESLLEGMLVRTRIMVSINCR